MLRFSFCSLVETALQYCDRTGTRSRSCSISSSPEFSVFEVRRSNVSANDSMMKRGECGFSIEIFE